MAGDEPAVSTANPSGQTGSFLKEILQPRTMGVQLAPELDTGCSV